MSTKMQLDMLNVNYTINVDVPRDIDIDYGDLSSVLINMFGNALDALEIYVNDNKKTESKVDVDKYHLKADIVSDEKGINIIVENVKRIFKNNVRLCVTNLLNDTPFV